MRALPLPAILALLPIALPATPDPGGGDASEDRESATVVSTGPHEGTLAPNATPRDLADWYRVLHPAGKGVRITAYADDTLVLHASGNGYFLASATRVTPWNATHYTAQVEVAEPAGVDFALFSDGEPASYTFVVETIEISDAEVVQVVVSPRPSCVQAVCDHSLDVAVTVRTPGSLPWSGSVYARVGGQFLGPILGRIDVDLEPGTTTTFHFPWTPVGAGDVTLSGQGRSAEDLVHSNDFASVDHTLVAQGLGRGFAVR